MDGQKDSSEKNRPIEGYQPSFAKSVDHSDPKQAPLGFGGGKWFYVRDYPKMDSIIESVKAFAAGGGAGAISKSVVAPIERTKVLVQTEHLKGTTTPIPRIMLNVLRNEGPLAFWKGNGANVLRIIPNKGILFMCNDKFVALLRKKNGEMSDGRRLLAGSMSGATLITFTYPLDITQTRLASGAPFRGIYHCLSDTIKQEGMRGLYRGYIPSLLGVMPYTGMQFYSYEKFKRMLASLAGTPTDAIPIWAKLTAGAGAGLVAQSCSYPLDTVRRRLQVQGRVGTQVYDGMIDCMRSIWREEGVRGFFRGTILNCLRAAPSQAVQFATYSTLKSLLNI